MAYTSLPAGASALHEEKYPVNLSDLKTFLDQLVPHHTVHAVAMLPEEIIILASTVTALCDVAFDSLVKAEHAMAIASLLGSSSMFPRQHPVLSELDRLTAEAVIGLQTLLGVSRESGEV